MSNLQAEKFILNNLKVLFSVTLFSKLVIAWKLLFWNQNIIIKKCMTVLTCISFFFIKTAKKMD